nr:NADH-plastoquinone oxidoreductase subunit 7 [Durio dulcis]YP_010978517.1 NADH-plastoquinone oxidoreductase subunit 7 [Ochroma pyramidale]WET30863.1 NADH-plastoquinone oxidoreductase subunit 7 [Durio dulcis]WHU24605.1 acetyl-CoA carboxylase beta subunit [Firmiana hainanensis]WOC30470.1 NADH-plastoquinone oxidoreductase subunit 7 [Ochroma pyramidale]
MFQEGSDRVLYVYHRGIESTKVK